MKQNKTVLDALCAEKKAKTKLIGEWKDSDFKKVHSAISRHFGRSYDYCSNWMGLTYTSSSSCAGEWVCNGEDYKSKKFPEYQYIGFGVGNDGNVYAILWDKDENEILQKIN